MSEPAAKKKWYRRPLVIIPTIIVSVLVLCVAAGCGYYWHINSKVNRVQVSFGAEGAGQGNDINYLILGSDSRQSGGDPTDWEYGAQRSDVLMVANISADRQHITLMSIPRDSWVEIPGQGMSKINAAYSYGGADLTVQTVQNLTGIRIDHFMIVDFESFKEITDLLGGVSIDTEEGTQTMDGDEALSFVRERYSLPGGDFDRVRRQQAWLQAIASTAQQQGVLSSAGKLNQYAEALLNHSAVDQNLGLSELTRTAYELRGMGQDGIQFLTAPVTGTGMEGDQSVVYLDEEKLAPLCKAWADGDIASYVGQHAGDLTTLQSKPVV